MAVMIVAEDICLMLTVSGGRESDYQVGSAVLRTTAAKALGHQREATGLIGSVEKDNTEG